jgi:hypothetical protein
MEMLKVANFFLSAIIPGFFLFLLLTKNEYFPKIFVWPMAYSLGTFFISSQIFIYLFIFQASFYFPGFLFLLITETLVLAFLSRHKCRSFFFDKQVSVVSKKIKLLDYLLIISVVFCVLFALSSTISRAPVFYDSLSIWLFKTKVVYFGNNVPLDVNNPLYLGGGGHLDYPWHLQLLEFWLFKVVGEYKDVLVNWIFFAYFLSLLATLFYFIKRFLSNSRLAWLGLFFLSSMPLVLPHSYSPYADLPLSLAVLVASAATLIYFKEKKPLDLVWVSIFWAMAFWTKDTAILFFLPFALVSFWFFWQQKELKKLVRPAIYFSLLVLPWMFFKVAHNLDFNNVGYGLGFHPVAIKAFFQAMFLTGSWNIWWYIVLAAFVFDFKKIFSNSFLRLGWSLLLSFIVTLLTMYAFTERYIYAINQTAVYRNLLILIPFSIVLVLISFKNLADSSDLTLRGQ